MNDGNTPTHLRDGQSPGRVRLECVMGRPHLAVKPMLHGPVAGHQDAQAIADHFALGRVVAGGDLGFDEACHFCGQRDVELLGCGHDGHSREISGI